MAAKPNAPAKVTLYGAPSGMPQSEDIQICVDEHNLFVYETAVNHNRGFSENPSLSTTPNGLF